MNPLLTPAALASPPLRRTPFHHGWRRARCLLLALSIAGFAGSLRVDAAVANYLSISDSRVAEPAPDGTVDMVFTVTRTGDLASEITVGFTTAAATARANIDFTPTTGTTTFVAGSDKATISIPILGNGAYNSPSLTFTVQLTGIVNVVGPPVTLAAPGSFTSGSNSNTPEVMASGDLNGDGRPDLVVANGSTVSVLFNTSTPGAATPSFAARQTFAASSRTPSVVIGDLNGDGRPDLAVANENASTVSVLLNTTAPGASTPSFAAQQTFATGSGPHSMAIGDLNGDGRPDLALTNLFDTTATILLNTTAPGATVASFAAQQIGINITRASTIAITEVNADGKPDLVVASQAGVSVFLNTTTPSKVSFASTSPIATGTEATALRCGDLNGDGRPDLAFIDVGRDRVAVLFNTTAPGAKIPSFTPKEFFTAGFHPFALAIGDLNSDGKPDLAVSNRSSQANVSVLLNTTAPGAETPTLAPAQTFASGQEFSSLALGDFNGDGLPDLAGANFPQGTAVVLLNTTVLANAAPDFSSQATFAPGSNPVSVAIGDLNLDGRPDIAFANYNHADVSVLFNTTAPGASVPSFAAQETFATGIGPISVVIGDLNGDGRPDLAVTSHRQTGTVSVLVNTTAPGAAAPSFAAQQALSTGAFPRSVAIADLNGDGRLDLAIADSSDATVSVLLNTTTSGAATVSFAARQAFPTGSNPTPVAIGDLNGDGRPDLAVGNFNDATVSVLLNTTAPGAATPSFASQLTYATQPYPKSLSLADLNGDGRADLAVSHSGDGTVSLLLNTTALGASSPSFATQQTFSTGYYSGAVASGDLNGDGRPDLALAHASDVSVLLNTTAPGAIAFSFHGQQFVSTGFRPYELAIADFNGDSRPDFAVGNLDDFNVSVLLNSAATIADNTATGTIDEGDPAPTVEFNIASEGVAQTAGTFTITVTLSDPSDAETTVPFTLGGTAVAGTDYQGVTASPLVIAAGETSGTITGTLLTGAPAAGKTITFTLDTPTGGTLGTTIVNTLTIASGPAASIATTGGTPQSTPANRAFADPLVATVLDQIGNPVPGASVIFSAPASGPSAVFTDATATTNASGQAAPTPRANAVVGGPFTVSATTTGAPETAVFQLTNSPVTAADFGFTTKKKAIDIDVLANDLSPGILLAVGTPHSGTATIVAGQIRYVPTGPLPAGGDTFTYTYDDGHGGTFTGSVTIVNFAAIAGTYDGLIGGEMKTGKLRGGTGQEGHDHSGYLRIALTKAGTFSGVLTFAGTKVSPVFRLGFRGFGFNSRLVSSGGAVRVLLRRPGAPIVLTLQYDVDTQSITGTAASTDSSELAFTSPLTLEAQTPAGALAGGYLLQVAPGVAPHPTGTGKAATRITAQGAVRLTGRLGDGTPFSSATALHADESFAIYAGLYPGVATRHGSLRGTLQFPLVSGPADDAMGTLEWFKPPRPLDRLFPLGFDVISDATLTR